MKSFSQYLTEAEKEHAFRVKVAGDLKDEQLDRMEEALKKYEAFSISKPKKTIMQSNAPDFDALGPTEINIIDLKTRQPVAPHILLNDIVEALDVPESIVRVKNPAMEEEELAADEKKELLSTDSEYSKDEHGEPGSKFYGDEFNSTFLKELAKDRATPKTEFAKKPEKVEVMKNESPGKDSPLSKPHNPDPRGKK
jgi:hypothetical protein